METPFSDMMLLEWTKGAFPDPVRRAPRAGPPGDSCRRPRRKEGRIMAGLRGRE